MTTLIDKLAADPSHPAGTIVPHALSSAHPYLSGLHQPMTKEMTITRLEVTGDLPATLSGRYLRIGPNPVDPDPATYHWFSGDGMIHALSIVDGEATWYRNRWIRSSTVAPKLGEEPAPGPRHGRSDMVNTNVLTIGGRTFALVEAGSTPVEMGDEMAGQAYSDFGGTLEGSFSAHPRRDPTTGEFHAICYDPLTPTVVRHVVVDGSRHVVREEPIAVTDGPSIHDCAITEHYVLVLDLPVTFSMAAARAGKDMPFRWNPDHGARVGLLPRDGSDADIVWCGVEPGYVFHTANAFEREDGKVVVDVCAYPTMFSDDPQGPNTKSRGLERWTICPDTRRVTVSTIDRAPQDFPRIDERRLGRPHRYVFTAGAPEVEGEQAGGLIGLYRHDLVEGSRQFHDFGRGRHPGEFVFVPRAADSAEGDGWLVGLVVDANTRTSEFVVLDAMDFEGEPTARVHLPHLVPQGFHGNWLPATGPSD